MTVARDSIPPVSAPRHVAIIMDGNGRWATRLNKPRSAGHRAGVKAVRSVIRAAGDTGIETLTLFAFSQENWQRPELEVKLLMQLFASTLARESKTLVKNRIRLRFIGDHGNFPPELRAEMQRAEALTAPDAQFTLVIAVGYAGQWDLVQAAQRLAASGQAITAQGLEGELSTAGLPPVDLLIRTGGERRISNFMLWQLAYTELYFSDVLWPDFGGEHFQAALAWFASRERRFGRVPEAA